MENKEIEIKGNGIRVGALTHVFMGLGLIIMIISFCLIGSMFNKLSAMMDAYQAGDVESDAAASFQTASNYLTNQARQFAVTGDIQNAENYFEEKDILKNREAALLAVEKYHTLDIETNLLDNAMELSEALVELELHAMKLTATALKLDETALPEAVAGYELTSEDLALNAAEQQSKAINILYSSEYNDYKAKIDWNVESAAKLIKDETETTYLEDESDFVFVLNLTTLLIFIMFVLITLIFIFTTLLVIRPARKFVDLLDKKVELPIIGGYEFRNFAKKYNRIYRSNLKNRGLLIDQGDIDELTGTLKAETLDMLRGSLSQHKDPMCVMMIDIDYFRSIKETHGYEMADKVVAKVANLLFAHFKVDDYLVRTGHDTFEMFLLKIQEINSEILSKRISQINEALLDSSDGVVSATISVGIAFAEEGYTPEIEMKADQALGFVKKNGRGNYKIS